MSAGKMYVDEVDTNVSLVVRLLIAQFPQWADFLSAFPTHGQGFMASAASRGPQRENGYE